jgi:phytoene/squalene synthetase
MWLKVFCDGDEQEFKKLRKPAMRLGSAFQKVNFLRDLKNDMEVLGRNYFPGVDYTNFTEETKNKIIADIEDDFNTAHDGIKQLPQDSKIAVLVSYLYYKILLKKLKKSPAGKIQETRMRISDIRKIGILLQAIIFEKLKLV